MDSTTPVVPAPAQAPVDTAQPAPAALTADTVKQLIQESLNPIAAAVRRMSQPAAPAAVPTEDAKEKSWQDRVKILEQREERAKSKARSTAIRQEALAAGVEANRVEFLLDHIERRYSNNITVDEDRDVVEFKDEFGTPVKLGDFMSKLLSGPGGELFKPAKNVPSSRGLQNSAQGIAGRGTTYAELTYEQRQALTPQQRAQLLKEAMFPGA